MSLCCVQLLTRGETMSWESTALEAALQRLNMGAKLKLVPATCHKYFKKKERERESTRLVHISVIAAFCL